MHHLNELTMDKWTNLKNENLTKIASCKIKQIYYSWIDTISKKY